MKITLLKENTTVELFYLNAKSLVFNVSDLKQCDMYLLCLFNVECFLIKCQCANNVFGWVPCEIIEHFLFIPIIVLFSY